MTGQGPPTQISDFCPSPALGWRKFSAFKGWGFLQAEPRGFQRVWSFAWWLSGLRTTEQQVHSEQVSWSWLIRGRVCHVLPGSGDWVPTRSWSGTWNIYGTSTKYKRILQETSYAQKSSLCSAYNKMGKGENVQKVSCCKAGVVVGWVSSPGAETPLLPWGWSPARKGNSRLGPWAGGLALLTNYGLRSHDFSRPLFLHLLNGFSRCVFTAVSGKTVNLGEGLRAGMVPQFL